jgi:hypothetical protein
VEAKAAGQDVLLLAEPYFPTLRTASPDFKTTWEAHLPQLKELIANKTIFGFALGDELVWGGRHASKPHHICQHRACLVS